MLRLEILATAVWSAWAIWLASFGSLGRGPLWMAATAGALLASAWFALRLAVALGRVRLERRDSRALALCPTAWLIAAGAVIWADLDLLKEIPIIDRSTWEGIIGNTAARPVNRTPCVHDCYVQQARTAGAVDVVWVGDSITSSWAENGRAVWRREFGRLRCLNLGIAGDRTQNILWRLEHGELDGPEPRIVVLEAGTNNLNRNTAGEIQGAIRAIVGAIRARVPAAKVVVMGVFPRGRRIDEPVNAKIRAVNAGLRVLDDGADVHVLDIGERFADASGGLRAAMVDGVHLSSEGYRIWAEAIRPTLDGLLDPKGREAATASGGPCVGIERRPGELLYR